MDFCYIILIHLDNMQRLLWKIIGMPCVSWKVVNRYYVVSRIFNVQFKFTKFLHPHHSFNNQEHYNNPDLLFFSHCQGSLTTFLLFGSDSNIMHSFLNNDFQHFSLRFFPSLQPFFSNIGKEKI
jgi:hypothetical protein